MVHSAFGSNRPLVLIFLILPATAMLIAKWYATDFPNCEFSGPAADLLRSFIQPFPYLRILLGVLLILGIAFLLNVIYNRNDLATSENYFPALIFTAFAALNLKSIDFHPIYLSSLLLLLALRRLLTLYRSTAALSVGFDSGFFLGLGVLFFPPSIILLPLIWIVFARLRPFNFKEWIAPLTGVLTVGLYTLLYYYLGDYELSVLEYFDFGEVLEEIPDSDGRFGVLSIAAFTLLLVIMGLYSFVSELRKSTLRKKTTKIIFLWTSFLLLMEFFFASLLSGDSGGIWLIMAIPVAVYGGVYFSGRDRRGQVRVIFFYTWLLVYLTYIVLAN